MLRELHINNFALIDESYLEFGEGLTVLTGETGAGKTVIIEAMNLLIGERADTTLIRTGSAQAHVEGLFSLEPSFVTPKFDWEESFSDARGEFVISRIISNEGKSKCYIGGRLVALSSLQSLGNNLVDLHGQHEHQSLLKPTLHLDCLDMYGGEELLKLRGEFAGGYRKLSDLREELERLRLNEAERLKRIDLLRFQIDEIERANLQRGEEESLSRERAILRNAERLYSASHRAYQAISGDETPQGALDCVRQAVQEMKTVAGIDESLDEICRTLESLSYEMEDCARSLNAYQEGVDFRPGRLDEIESRLALVDLLKKKYGKSIEEIVEYKDKAEVELDELAGSGNRAQALEGEVAELGKELGLLARKISDARKRTALRFEKEVQLQLQELNMTRAKFKVAIEQESHPDGLPVGEKRLRASRQGVDRVEFLISPNPGEPLKPLVKIASGGEISRIMLALKIILAGIDNIPILIFDEIDVGIGGKTASAIGQKLALLARNHQVICVTHLPQIASFADRHFYVYKKEVDGRTSIRVEPLDSEGRTNELARMLSGMAVSEVSRKHAKEMIKSAEKVKAAVRG
ncbi:MAG TPA: DNA repair protein RecN [Actinobacteria bacterium]|nr:DNA repair protein RecN [Actinomycetota bacterium]